MGPVGFATGSTSILPKPVTALVDEEVALGAVTAAVATVSTDEAGAASTSGAELAAWAGMAIAAMRPPEAATTAEPLASGVPAWLTTWPNSATGL